MCASLPVGAAPGAASGSASAVPAPARWIEVPRVNGRLTARDLGLVINTADPYSVATGEFYAAQRKLAPSQILRVALPVKPQLTPDEFRAFAAEVEARFGASTQALALAWSAPYSVGCNSITGALTLGYDAALCDHSCGAPRQASRYFGSATTRPHADLKLRPSMLLAARDVASAKALIRRGLQADGSLGLRGALPAHAYFVTTGDRLRSVRTPLFPPAGRLARFGLEVHVEAVDALVGMQRVLLYETGATQVANLQAIDWAPGALADHLTSFGGVLDGQAGQMSAIDWISSGATASYGTVSEPCSHLQKFPHPQLLLLNYLQGATAIEAYWKSVAWPQQGVFIGDPLAAPYARR